MGYSATSEGRKSYAMTTPASPVAQQIATELEDEHVASPTEYTPEEQSDRSGRRAHIIFLSLNDVYELLPNDDGHGGVAEFASLLHSTRQELAQQYPDATIIVTLSGDFLWRSELDRRDKGPLMMEVLRCFGIEYVVLGNHEFDHGAEYLKDLLSTASFVTFGSNVRCNADGSLFPGVLDTQLIELHNGMTLGLFGVCTTETGKDPFAGESVRFDDEIEHARRCVEELQARGADVIVALNHLKMKQDKQMARKVPGISLILGGHDHEVMTEYVGNTMIHKSGQDALWLAIVQLHVTKRAIESHAEGAASPAVDVTHEWEMRYNVGYRCYPPHQETKHLVDAYLQRVLAEDIASGKVVPLARSVHALDGTRYTSRRRECGVGYLVTDAMRTVLATDVALIHAGLIKGDQLNPPGFTVTKAWLERILPQPKPVVVIEMPAVRLKCALEHLLRRFPSVSSSTPQTSGLLIEFEEPASTSVTGTIASLRLVAEPDEELIASERHLRVAVPRATSMDGWQEHFEPLVLQQQPADGPIVRDIVEMHLSRLAAAAEISYASNENRLRIIDRTR